MELLTEEVSFVGEEDFCAFDLPQVEALRLGLLCSCHDGIAEGCYMLAEFLSIIDDLVKDLLFVRLEGK